VANWKDYRFAPSPSLFLLSRLHGSTTISIAVGNKEVQRHYVASALSKTGYSFFFVGDYVEVFADNLIQARRAATIAFDNTRTASGKTVVMPASPQTNVEDIKNTIPTCTSVTTYKRLDEDKRFASCLVNYAVYVPYARRLVARME